MQTHIDAAVAAGVREALERLRETTDEIEGAKLLIDGGRVVWVYTSDAIDQWLREQVPATGGAS